MYTIEHKNTSPCLSLSPSLTAHLKDNTFPSLSPSHTFHLKDNTFPSLNLGLTAHLEDNTFPRLSLSLSLLICAPSGRSNRPRKSQKCTDIRSLCPSGPFGFDRSLSHIRGMSCK